MECVGCAACVDECNDVMETINKEKGLIRFASENEITTGNKFHFNNRMKAYSILLFILMVFLFIIMSP